MAAAPTSSRPSRRPCRALRSSKHSISRTICARRHSAASRPWNSPPTSSAVFLYGGYRVLVLDAAPGEFISFIAAFLLAYEPAKRIARLNLDLHNALAGGQVLFVE